MAAAPGCDRGARGARGVGAGRISIGAGSGCRPSAAGAAGFGLGALVELTGLAPASVSEHLKVLRKCGLLVLEVRGRSWIYSTDVGALRAVVAGVEVLAADPANGGH